MDLIDIPTVGRAVSVTIHVVVAAVLGGLLGFEREKQGKPAGLRTHMLVALGAALFVIAPLESGASSADLTRVVQGIATGIGFVGAGTILKPDAQEEDVKGITTAAGIWLTAAVGVAVGMGRVWTAILGTALALAILSVVARLEVGVAKRRRR